MEQQRELAVQLRAHLLQLMGPGANQRLIAALSPTAERTQLSIPEEQQQSVAESRTLRLPALCVPQA